MGRGTQFKGTTLPPRKRMDVYELQKINHQLSFYEMITIKISDHIKYSNQQRNQEDPGDDGKFIICTATFDMSPEFPEELQAL